MGRSVKRIMSVDTMRVGKRYCLINHGDTTAFQVLAIEGTHDFSVKDLQSLEVYRFSNLIAYGLGEDFELFEV